MSFLNKVAMSSSGALKAIFSTSDQFIASLGKRRTLIDVLQSERQRQWRFLILKIDASEEVQEFKSRVLLGLDIGISWSISPRILKFFAQVEKITAKGTDSVENLPAELDPDPLVWVLKETFDMYLLPKTLNRYVSLSPQKFILTYIV